MLLNLAIFIWFGAVCPWTKFGHNAIIPIYRLIFLGILILFLRRVPIVLAMGHQIHQIENNAQSAFVGFFGPIGVGAIFYLLEGREFLRSLTVDGVEREDARQVAEAMDIVIWFLVVCSIVVHGLSVPLGKAAYHLPRTVSTALNSNSPEQELIPMSTLTRTNSTALQNLETGGQRRKRNNQTREPPRAVLVRLGRSVVRKGSPTRRSRSASPGQSRRDTVLFDKTDSSGADGSLRGYQSVEDRV